MRELQANTQVKVPIGPFVDVGDGFTPQTDITLGGADEAEIIKHDAASVTDISSNTWAAITSCDGWYNLTLSTTDTNTEGLLTVVVQDDSDCLPVHVHFMVLAQAAWLSKYTAKDSGLMGVDVVNLGGAAQSATDLKDLADTGYDPTAHKIQGVVLTDGCTSNTDMRGTDNAATEAKQDIIDTVVDGIQTDLSNATDGLGALKDLIDAAQGDITTIAGYTDKIDDATDGLTAIKAEVEGLGGAAMRGTDNAALAASYTATRAGYLDELAAANIPADLDAVLADTGTDGVIVATNNDKTGYGLANDAITSAKFDESTAFPLASADTGATAVARTGADSDTLETLSDQIDGVGASAIADAVWDEATTGHTTAGTFGEQTKTDIDAILVDTNSLNDGAISELSQAAPTATPTVQTALMLLYMIARNKLTTTGTELGIYNDAGTKIAKSTLGDDGTTFTRGELGSGA